VYQGANLPKSAAGRRTKCDAKTTAKLVKAIRLHGTHRLACQYAGISQSAFYGYLRQGEADLEAGLTDTPHTQFLQAIKGAEGEAGVEALETIEKAAHDGSWQAAAWSLERRYPNEYGRRVHDVHGLPSTREADAVRELADLPLDELRKLAADEVAAVAELAGSDSTNGNGNGRRPKKAKK